MSNNLTPLQTELIARVDAINSSISGTVSKAATFTGEQLPDIATQYVLYGQAVFTLFIVMSIIGMIGSIYFISRNKLNNDTLYNSEGFHIFSTFICGISFLVFCLNIKGALLVWFAPKAWLITEIVRLVK